MNLKYFVKEEFACPCCGKNETDPEFLERIDLARFHAGIPFHVNSGWRCKRHNEAVGGRPESAHLKGLAADIQAKTGLYKYKVVDGAMKAGIKRIGIYPTFIHLDIDPDKPNPSIF